MGIEQEIDISGTKDNPLSSSKSPKDWLTELNETMKTGEEIYIQRNTATLRITKDEDRLKIFGVKTKTNSKRFPKDNHGMYITLNAFRRANK